MGYGKLFGAVLAGTAALVGTYLAGKESGVKEGRENGYREAKAEHANEIDNLKLKLGDMLKDIAKREDFILCAYAVGISCANANEYVSRVKVDTLGELVLGMSQLEGLSKATQEKLAEMTFKAPNMNTVWALIKKHGYDTPKYTTLFTQIVDVMASIENNPTQRDTEFVEVWNTLVAA